MFRKVLSALTCSCLVIMAANLPVLAQEQQNDTGIYLDNSYFDDSLPATYERCQDTKHMENYLNSLDNNDGAKLKKFNAFLIGCQALLQDRIAKTKEQIYEIEAKQEQNNKK